MALEPDIVERVQHDFGGESAQALDLLRQTGKTGRVARCIVVASHGSLNLLRQLIERAKVDDRDAIMAGEYDSAGRQVRDLAVSFLLDSPETFWLGQVARVMASRDYMLTSLDSRAATAPPFVYTADRSESRARFVGPEGEIEVEKRDRRWSIRGDPKDLERHNMDRVFDNERAFRDAVSGYILMRRRPRASPAIAVDRAGGAVLAVGDVIGARPAAESQSVMPMVTSPPLIAKGRRCPCDCDENGALVFLSCPRCGKVVLLCDEIGNVFDNLTEPLCSKPLVLWRSSHQHCPVCREVELADFAFATEDDLFRAGLSDKDFELGEVGSREAVRRLASA